jgi:hypothetical protein
MPVVTWASALDEFEDHLARYEAALADPSSAPYVAAPVTTEGLGPVPTSLAPRALEISARYEAAVQYGEAAQRRIRDELVRVMHARAAVAHHDTGATAPRVEFTA